MWHKYFVKFLSFKKEKKDLIKDGIDSFSNSGHVDICY